MKRKYEAILKYEERAANILAMTLVEPKQTRLGIKMLFPLLFLIDYLRIKTELDSTKENLLFTKKLALDAARNIKNGEEKRKEMEKIISETNELLEKDREGIYSEKIRDKQLEEIEILVNHYLKLLNVEGEEYMALVSHAYSKNAYLSFLRKLGEAEKRVNQAAIDTLRTGGKKELGEWCERLEDTVRKIRIEEINKIFPEG